ncbi:C-type lectin domain family 4 member F-like [Cloeon dipterum]|uniref:C-type lectin domain family 4 member F-like n=1 Tax=Cloeon dipterum TaxID=197152 RepID=UPI00321F61DA
MLLWFFLVAFISPLAAQILLSDRVQNNTVLIQQITNRLDTELKKCSDSKTETDAHLGQLKWKLEQLQSKNQDFEVKVKQEHAFKMDIQASVDYFNVDIENLNNSLNNVIRISRQLETALGNSSSNLRKEINDDLQKVELKLQQLDAQDGDFGKLHKKTDENVAELKTEIASLKTEVGNLKFSLNDATQDCKKCQSELAEAIEETKKGINAQLDGLKSKFDEIESKNDGLKTKIDQLESNNRELKQIRTKEQDELKEIKDKLALLTNQVETQKKDTDGRLNDVVLKLEAKPEVQTPDRPRENRNKDDGNLDALLAEINAVKQNLQIENCRKAKSSLTSLTKLANGKSYLFSSTRRSWYKAKEYCESIGLHLASPKTQSELKIVRNKAATISQTNWWLSASDIGREAGDFQWHDGTILPLNSPMWAEDLKEPDSYRIGSDTCVDILSRGNLELLDYGCANEKYAICELPAECI